MEKAIKTYLEYPAFAIFQLKNKKNRYSPFCKVQTKGLMFVDNIEDEIIFNAEFYPKLVSNYAKEVLELAEKDNIYYFESRIFDDENIDMFFNKETVEKIKQIKSNIIDNISNKKEEELSKKDYLVLISLIGKDNINIDIKRLMYTTYRDLLSKNKINFYEAEFLIKHTLDFKKSSIKSYISDTSYYDEKFDSPTFFYYDEEEKVLIFNKDYIKRMIKHNKNDYTLSIDIVLKSLESAFLETNIDDLYDGIINDSTLELAITNLLYKSFDNYDTDNPFSVVHNSKLDAIHFFETKLQKNEGVKRLRKNTEEEKYYHLTKEDIRYLDKIIYYFPEELDNYKILRNFYDEQGIRKKIIDIDDKGYVIDLFNNTMKKEKTLEKTPNIK